MDNKELHQLIRMQQGTIKAQSQELEYQAKELERINKESKREIWRLNNEIEDLENIKRDKIKEYTEKNFAETKKFYNRKLERLSSWEDRLDDLEDRLQEDKLRSEDKHEDEKLFPEIIRYLFPSRIRIKLDEVDFQRLVQGRSIFKEKNIEICLSDIGYSLMSDLINSENT